MDLNVGQKRNFSFDVRDYIICEIIDKPNINLLWSWDTGACPHCKKKLAREYNHSFVKIEILLPDNIEVNSAKKTDFIIFGNTLDGKNMVLPESKYTEVFNKSKLFKSFAEEQ